MTKSRGQKEEGEKERGGGEEEREYKRRGKVLQGGENRDEEIEGVMRIERERMRVVELITCGMDGGKRGSQCRGDEGRETRRKKSGRKV